MSLNALPLRQEKEAFDPDQLPAWEVRLGFYLFCAATAFVILGLTAYTFNIDDIKIPGLFVGGSACLVYWSYLLMTGRVAPPPAIVWGSYVGFLVASVLSTILAAPFARWIGWFYVEYYTALLGFVLLGSATLTTKKMVELALKFWVLLTFVTTAFGLIHYSGLLEAIYRGVWGDALPQPEARLQQLVRTFVGSRSMLSTILNVQFFGNFLLMTLPVVVACLVVIFRNLQRFSAAGVSTRRPMIWSVISGLSIVFALTCIFTTYAKSSIFLLPAMAVTFGAAVYLFCGVRKIPYMGLITVLGLVMGATVFAFVWADLTRELKNVEESMAPRRIIWGGAVQMFQHSPLLGMGPGSFRIFFPEFRSPDYHLTRISNVTMYAHNWLLDLLAENGVIGTSAYLIFLGSIVWLGWLGLRRCPDVTIRVAVVSGVLAIGGLLGGSATTPMSRWPVGSVALHAMIGTALGVILFALRDPAEVRAAASALPKPGRRVRQIGTGLLAAAVVFCLYTSHRSIRHFQASIHHNEGLALSEGIPAHLLGDGVVLQNPRIIALFREAERQFLRSLELNPYSATTYYKLAHVHNRLGDTELALQAYRNLQRISPDYAEIHFNLAIIHYNLAMEARATDLEQAKAHMASARGYFDRASELSNKISVWFYRANAYELSAGYEERDSEAYRQLMAEAGRIYRHTQTLPISQVVQESNQREREAELRLTAIRKAAECLSLADEWIEAAAAAEAFLQETPNSFASLQMAVRYYQRAGMMSDALRVIDERLNANPLNGELHYLRYLVLRDSGDWPSAEEQGKFLLVLHGKLGHLSDPLLSTERLAALRADLARRASQQAPQVTP